MSENLENLERFVKFASRGGPGASSGEQICRRLAKALDAVGDDLALLDGDTIAGLCMLICAMGGPWRTDAEKEMVFTTVRRAAGRRMS